MEINRMALPSALEQMSEESAIDQLHRLGDLGTTSTPFLQRLLPHCTAEQLEHIETETAKNGRHLSSITDELWRKHYGRRFGEDHAKEVEERLAKASRRFNWRALYKVKLVEQEEHVTVGVDRLRDLVHLQNAKKGKRKIQVVDKVPPESRKQAKTTTAAPIPAGSGGRSSKTPARGKEPPSEAGMSSKGKTSTEVEEEKKPERKGGPERGRLWRKSAREYLDQKLRMTHAPPERKR